MMKKKDWDAMKKITTYSNVFNFLYPRFAV